MSEPEASFSSGGIMPIIRLLQNALFGPEEIRVLVRAFDDALGTLQVDRSSLVAEALAKKIIELAQQGERDPKRLRQHAVRSVSQSELNKDTSHGDARLQR
jgi:hypothetical protein